jgi:drug/metabolite transporter (DMT)-like permease
MFGVIVGWVGVVIMIGGDALQSLGTHVVAQLACVAATLSYAFAGIFGRRFTAMGVSSLEAAAGQVTASSIILIPVMLVMERPWTLPAPSLATIGALLGIGVFSTALAYISGFWRRPELPTCSW